MNEKVKEIIESYKDKDDLDIPNFDNILSDAYDANVWDEMIETLKQAGIILYKPDTDKILEECEERRRLIEMNKAIEQGINK